ncbi:MAG TPA: serine/threonine-protein kinase, partial [Gemmataceae bacterium]|nr:serine/threonine-protein kinase [Gemmataceae bacterium]
MNTEAYRPSVDELLIDWELQRQKGTPVTPEELCRDCPELLDTLKERIAEQIKASQLLATPTEAETKHEDGGAQKNDDIPAIADLATQSKFRNLRFHAKGGLGEVWKADDETLGRQVALKLIQSRHSHRDDALERFRREAEITSGLEHPGVVPVHSIGNAADGRPCYTMRFIEGETLREAIRKFHNPPSPRGSEGTGVRGDFASLSFRQLLRHFIDVCNTVAYAHSRGIIHRDLKPANI